MASCALPLARCHPSGQCLVANAPQACPTAGRRCLKMPRGVSRQFPTASLLSGSFGHDARTLAVPE
eukprot:10249499-Alexandrium_andersonii.AAC.1